jgi:hypothetical protein
MVSESCVTSDLTFVLITFDMVIAPEINYFSGKSSKSTEHRVKFGISVEKRTLQRIKLSMGCLACIRWCRICRSEPIARLTGNRYGGRQTLAA